MKILKIVISRVRLLKRKLKIYNIYRRLAIG